MSDHPERREPRFDRPPPPRPAAAPPGLPAATPPGFAGPRAIYKAPHAAAAQARRSRIGGFVVNGLLGLVAVAIALVTFLVIAPPTDLVRDRLVAEVKARTGRDLVIAGETRFSFLPSLGLSARDVTLSAPDGMPGEPLLVAEAIEVRIAALPLVTRDVRVERLVLQRPRIDLRIDRTGRRSWDFAAATDLHGDGLVRYAQAAQRGDGKRLPPEAEAFAKGASTPPAQAGRLGGLSGISLADVRIVEGRVAYADDRSGRRHVVDGLDARLALPEITGPLELGGSLVAGGEPLAFSIRLASLADVLAQRESKVAATINGRPVEASWEGLVTAGDRLALDGRIAVKAASPDALARLGGFTVPGADGQAFVLEGQLKGSPENFTLSAARLALGEATVQGRIGLDTTGTRPQVNATLRAAALDLDRLAGIGLAPLPPGAAAPPIPPAIPAAPAPATAAAPPAAMPAAPPAPAPRSIEDIIKRTDPGRPGPQVKGFVRRDGWSQEPIDATALRLADVEGRFEIAGLTVGGVKVGASQIAVSLKSGVLRVNVTEARLYGGTARGNFTVDARQPALAVGVNLSADGVQTLALLKDAGGFDLVDGRGRVLVVASGQGGSEREIVSSLTGKAELAVTDGALLGWSATDMIAGLAKGQIPSFDRNPAARTPFTRLAGTMPIANGAGRTQDLKLEAPSVEATGAGVVNIVDRNIDITLKPKPIGGSSLAGIEVPVRIAGPWGEVRAIPDLNAAMRSPQAQEVVRNIGRQLQTGDVEGAARSLLGNDPKADEKIGRAKGVLKQLFGR